MPGLSKAAELRQERRRLAERMNEITEDPRGENGGLASEQKEEWDRLHERQEELRETYETIEESERILSETGDESRGTVAGRQDMSGDGTEGGEGEEERGVDPELEQRAFGNWLRHGVNGLNPEERSVMQNRHQTLSEEQRAMSTGLDSAGGYAIPEGFWPEIQSARKNFGGMRRSRSTIIPTDSGNDLPIPTDDDTSNKGRLLGENTAASEKDITIGQKVLRAYTYSSDMVKVPVQLLQDSGFPLEGWLIDKLNTRIGRKVNEHLTVGDGSSKPEGVAEGAAVGKTGATGQATSVSVDDLIELQHSVDIDYRESPEWMFHDQTLKSLKQLKDGEGRPIWLSGIAVREPDTILGDPYIVNNDVAQMAANAKSILYGDFSLYWIRDVNGMVMLQLRERFAEAWQVAFLAFSRHDGKLIDAGTNPIKAYKNAAS